MQSHKCAYLDSCGDQCRGEEWCQYKLAVAGNQYGPLVICGKDQIVAIHTADVL